MKRQPLCVSEVLVSGFTLLIRAKANHKAAETKLTILGKKKDD